MQSVWYIVRFRASWPLLHSCAFNRGPHTGPTGEWIAPGKAQRCALKDHSCGFGYNFTHILGGYRLPYRSFFTSATNASARKMTAEAARANQHVSASENL